MADDGKKSGGSLREMVTVESMVQIALALPICCVIGWFGGAALDEHFHQSWIGMVGILLGAVAGFIQIFRTASKYMNRGPQ
jgi:ATP synthase protein I